MTVTPTDPQVRRLHPDRVSAVRSLLETGFGGPASRPHVLLNQYLLAALDRGEHERFAVWPGDEVRAVCYLGSAGTIIPAGDPDAGAAFAAYAEGGGWRVLIGEAAIGNRVVEASAHGMFRRRPYAREQRYMICTPETVRRVEDMDGLRLARREDLERLTEFAARLHVEDRMGPPLSRSGRASVQGRMRDSVERRQTWVVERAGEVVGKFDLSLYSSIRGAQIAGVYVDRSCRGGGIAGRAIAAISTGLLDDGLPGVTLHVRADNASAKAAYRWAGYRDVASWTLALR